MAPLDEAFGAPKNRQFGTFDVDLEHCDARLSSLVPHSVEACDCDRFGRRTIRGFADAIVGGVVARLQYTEAIPIPNRDWENADPADVVEEYVFPEPFDC